VTLAARSDYSHSHGGNMSACLPQINQSMMSGFPQASLSRHSWQMWRGRFVSCPTVLTTHTGFLAPGNVKKSTTAVSSKWYCYIHIKYGIAGFLFKKHIYNYTKPTQQVNDKISHSMHLCDLVHAV